MRNTLDAATAREAMTEVERERDLTRDEVFVGGTELPQEWARDNAHVGYRILKASGWWGRAYAVSLLLSVIAGMTGILDRAPWLMIVSLLIGVSALVVGVVRVRRGRRRV